MTAPDTPGTGPAPRPRLRNGRGASSASALWPVGSPEPLPAGTGDAGAAAQLRAAAEAELRRCSWSGDDSSADASAAAPLAHRATLRFASPALEAAFRRDWDALRTRTHDQQGAAVYLAMVLGGGALLMAGRVLMDPGLGPGCDTLLLWSCLVPASHLLMLALVPPQWYQNHRTAITLAYRAAYLAFTAPPTRGFGACVVGSYVRARAGGAILEESLFSAGFWRAGMVGLWWYPAAFPLLMVHHIPAQILFAASYALLLPNAVCTGFETVAHGRAAIRWLWTVMEQFKSVFLAAHGFSNSSSSSFGGSSSNSSGGGSPYTAPAADAASAAGCATAVIFVQLAAGLLLPTFLAYAAEARARRAWVLRERAALRVRGWIEAVAAEEAAAAAAAPDAAGPSGVNRVSPLPRGPSRADVAAAAAAATAAEAAASDGSPSLPATPGAADAYLLMALTVLAWLGAAGRLPFLNAALRAAGLLETG